MLSALAILAAAGPVTGRVRGLVFVGERRWDIVLDRSYHVATIDYDKDMIIERSLEFVAKVTAG